MDQNAMQTRVFKQSENVVKNCKTDMKKTANIVSVDVQLMTLKCNSETQTSAKIVPHA